MDTEYDSLMVPWHGSDAVDEDYGSKSELGNSDSLHASRGLVEAAYQQMLLTLCTQLQSYIYAQDFTFFERLVVEVVHSMGYGGRQRDLTRAIGRSGDGGIDGVIAMDELGLDVIYIQAKRLKPGSTVPVSAVRDFVGSLDTKRAGKGIFVTTGQFTAAAQDVVNSVSKKIVLISGTKLCELMVRYNIGIKATETMQFKEIDIDYFSAKGAKPTTISASIQPRR